MPRIYFQNLIGCNCTTSFAFVSKHVSNVSWPNFRLLFIFLCLAKPHTVYIGWFPRNRENLSLSTLFPEELDCFREKIEETEDDFDSEWGPDGDFDDWSEPESDDDGNMFDAFNDDLWFRTRIRWWWKHVWCIRWWLVIQNQNQMMMETCLMHSMTACD